MNNNQPLQFTPACLLDASVIILFKQVIFKLILLMDTNISYDVDLPSECPQFSGLNGIKPTLYKRQSMCLSNIKVKFSSWMLQLCLSISYFSAPLIDSKLQLNDKMNNRAGANYSSRSNTSLPYCDIQMYTCFGCSALPLQFSEFIYRCTITSQYILTYFNYYRIEINNVNLLDVFVQILKT